MPMKKSEHVHCRGGEVNLLDNPTHVQIVFQTALKLCYTLLMLTWNTYT
jgi:hypothetical protein